MFITHRKEVRQTPQSLRARPAHHTTSQPESQAIEPASERHFWLKNRCVLRRKLKRVSIASLWPHLVKESESTCHLLLMTNRNIRNVSLQAPLTDATQEEAPQTSSQHHPSLPVSHTRKIASQTVSVAA